MFSLFIGSICSVIVVFCRCLCTCLLDQWKHLSDIPFPELGKRSKIDVLIGSDHYNLLFPMEEVRGSDNEPSVRLCALS